ncbi:alpha/beta-hydrolase [Violaceomyces palustris]|uniref:Alpha/beta-hydrolase n=1 Tax=Violaceomyces palustris TaxID=1673888 RepID=A0ACD0P5L2_9BASI|nr:alpha/beta-hydrolase [Violaceomyces palustris]
MKVVPLPLAVLTLFISGPVWTSPFSSNYESENEVASRDASQSGPYGLRNSRCKEELVEVSIKSKNFRFRGVDQYYSNQSYVTGQILEYTLAPKNWTDKHMDMSDTFENVKTYKINTYYCEPIKGAKEGSSLISMLHGIGFDSSYWDYNYKLDYSFVRQAASYGYSTLRIDRLGCGKSDTPKNGFDEAQAATEVAIYTEILKKAKQTTKFGGKKHERITGIGHSYGSIQTQSVSSRNPELLDGVILTGYTTDTSNLVGYLQTTAYSIAKDTLPHLASKPSTWLATGSEASDIINFFYPNAYDQASFDLARSTEQAVTLGSLFTIGTVSGTAKDFKGPVQVVTGAKDFIFCSSNCWNGDGSNKLEGVKDLYPAAKSFDTLVPEAVGHGVTAHRAQPEISRMMLEFIMEKGL